MYSMKKDRRSFLQAVLAAPIIAPSMPASLIEPPSPVYRQVVSLDQPYQIFIDGKVFEGDVDKLSVIPKSQFDNSPNQILELEISYPAVSLSLEREFLYGEPARIGIHQGENGQVFNFNGMVNWSRFAIQTFVFTTNMYLVPAY